MTLQGVTYLQTAFSETERPSILHIPTSSRSKHDTGEFFTPIEIARLMVGMFSATDAYEVAVLDPGSGKGILTRALVEKLMERRNISAIHVDAFEISPELAKETETTLSFLNEAVDRKGIRFSYEVKNADFLAAKWRDSRPSAFSEPGYDFVIMNPPYYKLRKDSEHSRLANDLVHGQPNVYGLFLALGCRLLRRDGQLVAIAPRSWLSGSYFSRIRADILSRVDIDAIRTFASRDKAFSDDHVLQETIIFHASRTYPLERPDVKISTSSGVSDTMEATTFVVPFATLCPRELRSGVRLPETVYQVVALRELDTYALRMKDFKLTVSTGPVVPFRTTQFLRAKKTGAKNEVKLIWMSHVQSGKLEWTPDQNQKQPTFILRTNESKKLIIEGEDMILVRRFSAKEDRRRVIACFLPRKSSGRFVGIENHLNVIRGFTQSEGTQLAKALTNYLNSELVDAYIRAVSGTTQVNALDLRQLPLPDKNTLLKFCLNPNESPWRIGGP